MPVKALHVTPMDIVRAREIVLSLAPLKGLSGEDAETVAKAIARCFAKGREQGLQYAKDVMNTGPMLPPPARWVGSAKEEG
jgi:hypothetical protein